MGNVSTNTEKPPEPPPGRSISGYLSLALKHGAFPALFYVAAFCLTAYSLLGKFFTEFWGDRMDALQNAWNLWWVKLALTQPELHPSIWYTNLLHWPSGATLVGHTLGPFNGYLGALLQNFLSLIPTYNAILAFSLITTGLTMYWLAYYLTRSYPGSLLAGYVFGLSSYGVMHLTAGQMDVVSMEWMPVFVLCWLRLITKPNVLTAATAAIALWLVGLCNYYFLLYCILTAAIMLAWRAVAVKDAGFVVRKESAIPLAVFTGLSLLLVGSLVAPLMMVSQRDPLVGAHDPAGYSLDLLALTIPGRTWLFHDWTRFYWSSLVESAKEGEGYLALPVYALVGYQWYTRRRLDLASRGQLYLWSIVLGFFFLLALGPALRVGGRVVWDKGMPYSVLLTLFPFMGLSGIPARMTAMVVFAAAILSALGLRQLLAASPPRRALAGGLLVVLVFEMLPAPIVTTSVKIPEYVETLRSLPDEGGVINLIGINPSVWLYYQTVHEKPIAFGYISRVPASVARQDGALQAAIDARDLSSLRRDFGVGYVIAAESLVPPADDPEITVTTVYDRKGLQIYRLGCLCDASH